MVIKRLGPNNWYPGDNYKEGDPYNINSTSISPNQSTVRPGPTIASSQPNAVGVPNLTSQMIEAVSQPVVNQSLANQSVGQPNLTPATQNNPINIQPEPVVNQTTSNPNITLANGQVISGLDPNYEAYKAQQITNQPNNVQEPPTVRDIFGYIPEQNTELDQARKDYLALTQSEGMSEEAIKSKTIDRFQSQIDALDSYYADVLNKERIAGEGRMGEATAIQARRGLIGSDFGASQKGKVREQNADAIQAVENVQQAQIQKILSEGRADVVKEAEAKLKAQQAGAEAYIAFLSGESDRKNARADSTIANLINAQAEPTDDELVQLAETLGTTPEQLRGKYNAAKAAAASEVGKLTVVAPGSSIFNEKGELVGTAPEAPADPTKPVTEKVGDTLLQWNVATGSWDKVFTDPTAAAGQKIVKVNGVDYVQNADGSLTLPEVPDYTPEQSAYSQERAIRTLQSVDELTQKALDNPGIFGRTAGMPVPDWLRTDAYRNFNSELDTLKSNIAFNELTAMREASKTGGALGQVSDNEGRLLQSALGALAMDQSPKNVVDQLQKIKASINRWQEAVGNSENSTMTPELLKTSWDSLGSNVDYQDAVNTYGEDGVKKMMESQGISFKPEAQTSLKGNVAKAAKVPDKTVGGQCGKFVNTHSDLRLGDSFENKMSQMDKSIKKPEPGMAFVMPYSWTGHTGIILAINGDKAIVKDSNWNLDERVLTHEIPVSNIAGLKRI